MQALINKKPVQRLSFFQQQAFQIPEQDEDV